MDFNEYQKRASKYDLFKATSDLKEAAFMTKVLGLVGEAGETAEKIKKILRDKDGVVSKEDKDSIAKELGDVLWYIASISRYLEIDLSDVVSLNIEKLESRYQRDRIHGEGDER